MLVLALRVPVHGIRRLRLRPRLGLSLPILARWLLLTLPGAAGHASCLRVGDGGGTSHRNNSAGPLHAPMNDIHTVRLP
eukprot:1789173-Prymnesium_polylepis.2